MNIPRRFAIARVAILSTVSLACALLTPTAGVPPVATNTSAAPSATPSAVPSVGPSPVPSAEPSAAPSVATATAAASATTFPTATATATPVPTALPTTAPLQLEIVQSQAWTDPSGQVRVNVLVRNPYDFPIGFGVRGHATLLNKAGKFMRDEGLYFLDGISGGRGFVLPGETIAANACFTCEKSPLTEEWGSVKFDFTIEDATGQWDYSTDVKANLGDVSFDGNSPIFWTHGTVKNNSKLALDRISVRLFVFDSAGKLVGAAEASAWDVGPGAAANFNGYGLGEPPHGAVKYEVTAVGVKYTH